MPDAARALADQSLLADDLAHIVWIASADGTTHYLNRYGREFLGLAASEAGDQAWLRLVHPDDAALVRHGWGEAVRTGTPYELEYRLRRADGEYRWIVERGLPHRGAGGQILKWVGTCTDIEAQKRAAASLQKSDERYRRLFDNALNGFALCELVTDTDGHPVDFVYLEVNQAFERLTGLAAAEVLGRRVTGVIPGIQATGVIERYGQVVLTREPARFEVTVPALHRSFDVAALAIGERRFAAIFTDITERKRAEQQLEQEKAFSDTLLASLPGMVYVMDRDGRLVRWNREYQEVVAGSGEELLGTDALSAILDEDRALLAQRIRGLFEGRGFDQVEARVRNPRGEVRDYIFSGQRVDLAGDQYLVGTGLDVTDRKRAEEALRISDERFRRYFELGLIGIAITSPAKGYIEVNDQLCEILGYERSELLQKTWTEITHPEDVAADVAHFNHVLAGELDGYSMEKRVIRKGGQVIHAAVAVNCVRRRDGSVDYFVALLQDITERKRAEAEQARLGRVVEQTTESIVITDPDGSIIYVNPAFERVSGYTRAETIGQNPRILKSGQQDAAFYRRMWDTLARGEVWTGRIVNRRKDGSLYQEDATIGPVRDTSGRLVNYVAVKRDVTNEMRLEQQLLHAQKMEAVGRLAGGVAHDFNNILGVIMGYAEMTRRRLPAGDPLKEKVDQIFEAAERAAGLTRQLLTFSRRQVLHPQIIDVNGIISDMKKLLPRLIGEDIELTTLLEPGLGNVNADPGQLEQLIMNLAVNSRDAMPEGGRLTIETQNASFDVDYVARHPLARPGRYVMLAVSDTGMGMDAETQSHVFEPFFTTKEVGKGTGLGLATVYGIVKQSEGFIWLYSEPGVGTTFKIYLPRVDGEVVPTRREAVAPLARGNETVLLIEDEPSLRDVLCESLEGGGYTLLVARDGPEALKIAGEHAGPIQLIVTDVIMPGMTGVEAVKHITLTRPEAKVLYISGYTDEAIAKHGVLSPGAVLLSKPFTPDDLFRTLRELLERR
jgi:PAS domain S-box-containing protein